MERARSFFASSLRLRFLLSREPISEPPQLAAGGLNEDMESATIRNLSRLRGRLGIPHRNVFEGHVGIVLFEGLRYQQKYQQIWRIPTNGSAS